MICLWLVVNWGEFEFDIDLFTESYIFDFLLSETILLKLLNVSLSCQSCFHLWDKEYQPICVEYFYIWLDVGLSVETFMMPDRLLWSQFFDCLFKPCPKTGRVWKSIKECFNNLFNKEYFRWFLIVHSVPFKWIYSIELFKVRFLVSCNGSILKIRGFN